MFRRLEFQSAGASHGAGIVAILAGLPRGIRIDDARLDDALDRRRRGHGRSSRQKLESDPVTWLGGVRHGMTTGAPVACLVPNSEEKLESMPPVHEPRPGHADLAGMLRWNLDDARDVLERASARETVVRVAMGSIARDLLTAVGIEVAGATLAIGEVTADFGSSDLAALVAARDASPVLCPDEEASMRMVEAIDAAKTDGDTLGGVVEVRVGSPLAGLGSHATAAERLDVRLAAALMSVPAVKGVEIGPAFDVATRRGSAAHDAILPGPVGLHRPTNHAGGIEGGMSNGEPIIVRAAMKPISTLMNPLPSVDVRDGTPSKALVERSDVCAVPPLGVIAEAMVAMVIADALIERVGGTTVEEIVEAVVRLRERARGFGRRVE